MTSSDTGAGAFALAEATGMQPLTDSIWPFRLNPRFDPKPWGGRGLKAFGLSLPSDLPIGEAVITAGEASVRDGPASGRLLGDLARREPAAIVGRHGLAATGGRAVFPLLVKLIDAAENLSIQVHPNDQQARHQNRLGKTEAWCVLAAAPGAVLYLGLRPGISAAEFAAACEQGGGQAGHCLRRLPAIPGSTVLIPAGTVHALGAGVVAYEVQQPSDVTYRLDDWGRVDAAGRPRDLHVDQGLAVLDSASRPEVINPIGRVPGRQILASCQYFALEQVVFAPGWDLPLSLSSPGTPQVITCLWGLAEVAAGGASVLLAAGETAVIPAAAPSACIRGLRSAALLRAWVPEVAIEIAWPAQAGDAADDEIARLAEARSVLADARRAPARAAS